MASITCIGVRGVRDNSIQVSEAYTLSESDIELVQKAKSVEDLKGAISEIIWGASFSEVYERGNMSPTDARRLVRLAVSEYIDNLEVEEYLE